MSIKLFWMSVVVAAAASELSCQVRQGSQATQGSSELFFLVGTITPRGERTWSRSESWNAAEDLPEVYVGVSSQEAPQAIDSLRLFARAGPVFDLDSAGAIADMRRTDSAAKWINIPRALLRSRGEQLARVDHAFAVIIPDSVQRWLTLHEARSPLMTKIAVEIWRHGEAKRVELRTAIPE